MKHLIPCLLLSWLCINSAQAQCPPNIDFEKGDFSGWQSSVGMTFSADGVNNIQLTNSNPVAGRHEIISAETPGQMDPYGNFPKLCPYGGKYSVKLGNENSGAEAEGISYTFRMPSDVDTLTFTYFYAVVFEDPKHSHFDQPRFFVTAYDVLTGDVINCASYNYVSTSDLPGFQTSTINPGVLFKNWSPVSLQFFGIKDRDVRLEFKTADCTPGAHFGYAYLDVGTACSNILATAPYCVESNSLILNAPYGFKDYTWYFGTYKNMVGTGQSVTFSPPPATSGSFFVDMVPYPGFGCRDTAIAVVEPMSVPPPPDVEPEIVYCQFAAPLPLMATALNAHELLWYSAEEGGIPVNISPVPSTAATGVTEYFVSQKKLFGCESTRKKITVIIRPTPSSAFQSNAITQCQVGNMFVFTSSSTNLSESRYYWDFGDGSSESSASPTISRSFKDYGRFNVELKVVNDKLCSHSSFLAVSVVPSPIADFDFPEAICEKETTILFTDKSYVPGNVAAVDQWNWNINGSMYNTRQVIPFSADNPGAIDIKLSVAAGACRSDTLRKTLMIRHRPVAAFDFTNAVCENELIRLKDLSYSPASGGEEKISGWGWEYDGAAGSSVQNPIHQFSGGLHTVRLVAKSNFGCSSLPMEETITVYSKPKIDLAINDSCVMRVISYEAIDLKSTVKNWHWDIGYGVAPGQSSVKKIYYKEGNTPLMLIGETIEGCKDTLLRPFRIYDNKSFAGNDTIVAKGQPVQLNAGGGSTTMYTWHPEEGLSDAAIEKPVATLDKDQLYTLYSITDKGCDSRSDIFIKRYKGAELYIPNAFTPDGDGTNDLLKVFPVGIKTFYFLAVYNRFGQRVYYSTDKNRGWNGMFNGLMQDSGNFVAVSKATDYNGNMMIRKQSVVLVR